MKKAKLTGALPSYTKSTGAKGLRTTEPRSKAPNPLKPAKGKRPPY